MEPANNVQIEKLEQIPTSEIVTAEEQAQNQAQEQALNAIRQNILDLHNKERALFGIPPLVLDDNLNKEAQAWSDNFAAGGKFAHSHKKGLGENIATRSPVNSKSPETMFNQWMNEKANYVYNRALQGDSIKGPVGHYRAIIWAKTTKLGVGYSVKNKKAWLVTNYSPAGNIKGQYPYVQKQDL